MVTDHPQQFAIALGMVGGLSPQKFSFNLLISPHPYWAKVDLSPYRDMFAEIHTMTRPDYNWNPLRVAHMIWQIQNLKQKVRQLNIAPNDIIMGFSIFHYLENITLSTHPDNLKIAVMPAVVYDECNLYLDPEIYYAPPEGLAAKYLVEPLTGLHRTRCMRERKNPRTYWRLRYARPVTEIFDKVVVLGTAPASPRPGAENVVTMPFPYVLAPQKTGREKPGKPPKVVFFGTNFRNGMWGLTPATYARHLNKCLAFLKATYGAQYRLVYRPHPAEKNEAAMLDLSGFEIERDGTLAELYFYGNLEDIYAVFSVESTASRSAFDFFLNAYVFLETFPYSAEAKAHFRLTQAGSVPGEFYLDNLSSLPVRYVQPEDIRHTARQCREVLGGLIPEMQE